MTRYERHPRALWRWAPDRVLVHIVDGSSFDLFGLDAVVFALAEQPTTVDEFGERVAEVMAADPDDVADSARRLCAVGAIVLTEDD